MNNIQFYIAVALPSVLVVLAWVQSNSRSADLKDSMNHQFDEVHRRFAEVDCQFEQVNRRLDRIDDDLKNFHNVTGVLEGRVDELSRKS